MDANCCRNDESELVLLYPAGCLNESEEASRNGEIEAKIVGLQRSIIIILGRFSALYLSRGRTNFVKLDPWGSGNWGSSHAHKFLGRELSARRPQNRLTSLEFCPILIWPELRWPTGARTEMLRLTVRLESRWTLRVSFSLPKPQRERETLVSVQSFPTREMPCLGVKEANEVALPFDGFP